MKNGKVDDELVGFGDDEDDEDAPGWQSDEERVLTATLGKEPKQTSWGEVAEASAKADEAKPPKPKRPRKAAIAGVEFELKKDERTGTEIIDVPLTNGEISEKARVLVRLGRERRALEETLKNHVKAQKGLIAAKAQEITIIEDAVESGTETREVETVVRRDDRLGELVTYEALTGVVLSARPMTFQERQLGLPVVDAAAPAEAPGAKPKVKRGRKPKGDAVEAAVEVPSDLDPSSY